MLPVQAILRGFYTTAVVNIITWNKAYAIFPDCTFLERKTYMLKPLDDFFGSQLVKYSNRGWTTLETQWVEDKKPWHSLQDRIQRRVGDSKTWVCKFPERFISWWAHFAKFNAPFKYLGSFES
jgi:hypothetical protein